jgi:hypothetical protein
MIARIARRKQAMTNCNVCGSKLFNDLIWEICLTCQDNLKTLKRWLLDGCCQQYEDGPYMVSGGVWARDGVLNVMSDYHLPDKTRPRPPVWGWFDYEVHGVSRPFPDWDVHLQMMDDGDLGLYCSHCHDWFFMPIFAAPAQVSGKENRG